MKIRERIQKIRGFAYEIGFYLFIFLLGYFVCLYFSIKDLGKEFNKFDERMTRAEDNIGKLNTQGLISESLKEIKKH